MQSVDYLPHVYTPFDLPMSSADLGLDQFEAGADNEDDALEVIDAESALLNGGLTDDAGEPVCAVCALGKDETSLHDLSADPDVDAIEPVVAAFADEFAALVAAGVCTGPGPCDTSPTGTGNNWVTKAGGLPRYIRAIAHAMKRKGRSQSQAIQIAIGTVKRWAAGSGNVTAATRARAAAAVAEWEALKARGRVASAVFAQQFDEFDAEFFDVNPETVVAMGWDPTAHPRGEGGKFKPLDQGDGYNEQSHNNKRVKHVQRMLKGVGISVGPAGVDGKLGPDTAKAIRSFQQAHGLKVTGSVNQNTLERLRHSSAGRVNRKTAVPHRTRAQREHHQNAREAKQQQRHWTRVGKRLDRRLDRIVRDATTGNEYVVANSSVTAAVVTGLPTSLPVSGIALKAADTGRVLMLQRGLGDETDPAAGKWEFPGGKPESDDLTSLHTGIREWQEEVGQPFPKGGVIEDTWRSPNNVYQGHIVVIPEESAVCLHQGRAIDNPDDPDGDESEQVAWWHPDDARKNPALREEAKTTPWAAINAAGPTPDDTTDDEDDPVVITASSWLDRIDTTIPVTVDSLLGAHTRD